MWEGSKDHYVFPWVKWEVLAAPKMLGGWGLKNIFLFSKAFSCQVELTIDQYRKLVD
jgi:hypothetical protein